jgi:predicted transcriptional regulator
METAKDEVRRILDALPDDATLEDIQYRIYVRQAIDAGRRDIAAGRTLSQEEVEQRVARWIGKFCGLSGPATILSPARPCVPC